MCGIAGWIDGTRTTREAELTAVVTDMATQLRHRGPDSSGSWADESNGVALGHTRLAILDLGVDGRQPMVSLSGRFVLAYNGEIYNFRELRRRLEGQGSRFRGTSDTEVFLAAIEAWGLASALHRSNGMFAFALWDREERRLILARDRIGEKPLYYAAHSGQVVFASELGAMRRHPVVGRSIDHEGLALLLRYNSIPAPRSILTGVSKLPAGCTLTIDCSDSAGGEAGEPMQYWSILDAISDAEDVQDQSDVAATDALEALLRDAVRLRMESDVPVGAFLSGGVDSSTVVALMQTLSNKPVKTFSIGSSNADYDEGTQARKVAAHLGTDHFNIDLTGQAALQIVSRLPFIYSEPFADSSQIPTIAVSQLAREHVTVGLSGDGGDELFGGYNRHRWVPSVWQVTRGFPQPLLHAAGLAITAMPPGLWRAVARLLPARRRPRNLDTKAQKLAGIIDAPSPWAMYERLTRQWQSSELLVVQTPDIDVPTGPRIPFGVDLPRAMMLADAQRYLPDDILVKLDRATMAVSLEGRVPFLDHRLVSFAFGLPPSMKLRGGESKWLLRRVLQRYVPPELTDRPKAGFGVPIGEWLRGPMKPWAQDLVEPGRLRRQGYLRPEPIAAALREHLSGARDRSHELWCVLMFQQWLEGPCQ